MFMFLLRLDLTGKAGGKGGAESFSKNCKPISIQTATSTLFKSRQRLQTCINQYNLVLQIWLKNNISKLTKVLPQPIRQPSHPPPRLHQQRPVEAGHYCIYMTQSQML